MSLAANRIRNKTILAIVILCLFLLNYHICNLFFKDDIINWWKLKLIIYTLIMGLCFILARVGTRKLMRFILSLGVGFCAASIFDRIVFNSQTYRLVDIIMVVLTIITSYIEVYVNRRIGRT